MRRQEYFTEMNKISCKTNVSLNPPELYHQQRDWTCCFACLRSITSGSSLPLQSEDEIVEKWNLIPGPHYSRDIKNMDMLKDYTVEFGCDYSNTNFDNLMDLAEQGYKIMVECMVNYAHWLVLLGSYVTHNQRDNIESYQILLYDPYYDEVRLMRTDEFISMWVDGDFANTGVSCDFIAIK